jgi:hypothetical protein
MLMPSAATISRLSLPARNQRARPAVRVMSTVEQEPADDGDAGDDETIDRIGAALE